MRFRKRPIEIEAVLWDGENRSDIVQFFEPQDWRRAVPTATFLERNRLQIQTLEGPAIANPGDWIIRGTAGEIYPCKPHIFEAVYEKVDE